MSADLRRTVLALLLVAGCRTSAPERGAVPALVGAWRAKVQFTDGAFATVEDLEFLYVFNAGGTLVESSNYDEAPPVPPAYGEWRQTAAGRFEAKYSFFTTRADEGAWMPAGSGVLVEKIALASDGRSYDSTLALELFDAAGKPVPGGGQAAVHARRAGF
jgi:hypothetical protein